MLAELKQNNVINVCVNPTFMYICELSKNNQCLKCVDLFVVLTALNYDDINSLWSSKYSNLSFLTPSLVV